MFIIVNWWYDRKDAVIVMDENGEQKRFITREEAEEYCNTELNGHYAVIDLEM